MKGWSVILILTGLFIVGLGIACLIAVPSTGASDNRTYELDYKPWKGATEIKMWVESTGISNRTYIIDVYDCDDMAVDLYFIALKEKRLVGLLQWQIEGRFHTMNFTFYGNRMYGIDPISNSVWFICNIDNHLPSWKIIPKKP